LIERWWSGFGASARFSLFYGALFLQVGVVLPFWPVVLAGRGLTPAELALVLAGASGARTLTGPLLGFVSDRFRLWRGFLFGIGLASAAGLAAFGLVHGLVPCLLLGILIGPLYPALTPIVDAHALRSAERQGRDFGRMRLWGSIAFLAANIASGGLIGALGSGSILGIVVSLTVLGALAALILPGGVHGAPGTGPHVDFAAIGQLLNSPRFVAILLIAGGIQTSHAVLYNFGTLAWRAQGLGSSVIGLLWATGVAAEVVLLTQAQRLLRRFGAERMLVLGGLAGLVRWGALALAPPLPLLFALQLLHALTFAVTFIAAIHLVQEAVPARLAATAQAIYTVAASGIFFSLVTAGAGPLYALFGSYVYVAPALLAGLCALAALFAFEPRGAAPPVSPTAPLPDEP
jgi:PPP family 3-phenylpropionic acid transporter